MVGWLAGWLVGWLVGVVSYLAWAVSVVWLLGWSCFVSGLGMCDGMVSWFVCVCLFVWLVG